MNNIKVPNCPFCGSDMLIIDKDYDYVKCKKCNAESQSIEEWCMREPVNHIIKQLDEKIRRGMIVSSEDVMWNEAIYEAITIIKKETQGANYD